MFINNLCDFDNMFLVMPENLKYFNKNIIKQKFLADIGDFFVTNLCSGETFKVSYEDLLQLYNTSESTFNIELSMGYPSKYPSGVFTYNYSNRIFDYKDFISKVILKNCCHDEFGLFVRTVFYDGSFELIVRFDIISSPKSFLNIYIRHNDDLYIITNEYYSTYNSSDKSIIRDKYQILCNGSCILDYGSGFFRLSNYLLYNGILRLVFSLSNYLFFIDISDNDLSSSFINKSKAIKPIKCSYSIQQYLAKMKLTGGLKKIEKEYF